MAAEPACNPAENAKAIDAIVDKIARRSETSAAAFPDAEAGRVPAVAQIRENGTDIRQLAADPTLPFRSRLLSAGLR
jgi:hypothetical protein